MADQDPHPTQQTNVSTLVDMRQPADDTGDLEYIDVDVNDNVNKRQEDYGGNGNRQEHGGNAHTNQNSQVEALYDRLEEFPIYLGIHSLTFTWIMIIFIIAWGAVPLSLAYYLSKNFI